MKSVRLCAALLVVSFLLVAVAVSSAQEKKQGQRGRGGFGGGMLLSAEQVQKELKLSEDQTKKIKEIADANRPDFAGLQNATPEERTKKMAEFAEKARETQKKAEEVLTADQKKRFKEITAQVRGLSDSEVLAALKLTDEQKSKIKAISDDTQAKTRELFQGGGLANADTREKVTQLRKESEEKTLAVLTADQKSQFEKMKGEKVSFDVAALRGGFFGRPGGTQKKNQ